MYFRINERTCVAGFMLEGSEFRRFLSRLNETSGGFEKIGAVLDLP